MSRPHVAVWSFGLAALALVAVAATQADPTEAPVPASDAVPAAESVETVLRATYVLPAGRGSELAEFLARHAAPGIDVRPATQLSAQVEAGRVASDRITVVAPADAQQALGAFIEKCISKEPRAATPVPADDFGNALPTYNEPTRAPATPTRKTPSIPGTPFFSQGA